jgi:FixJ family two-component response regulator
VEQNEALHKELTAHVDLEYNNFTLRLKDQFQVLTERDLFFCCLLLAKFETGMIATVLDVNIESVNKHRHRLRKKLQVSDSTENLVDFLRNF